MAKVGYKILIEFFSSRWWVNRAPIILGIVYLIAAIKGFELKIIWPYLVAALVYVSLLNFIPALIQWFKPGIKNTFELFLFSVLTYLIPLGIAVFGCSPFLIEDIDWVFISLLSIWITLYGMNQILIHQFENLEKVIPDKELLINEKNGKTWSKRRFWWIVFPEILTFLAFTTWISITYLTWFFVLPVLWVFIKYPIERKFFAHRFMILHGPYGHSYLNPNYSRWLPYWALAFCILISPYFFLWLVIHAIAFQNILPQWAKWPFMKLNKYRLLLTSKKENKNPQSYKQEPLPIMKNGEDAIKLKGQPKQIALVNRSRAKFSETFVRQHVLKLPFQVHYLHGKDSYFPRFKINHDHIHPLLFLWEDNLGKPPASLNAYYLKKYFSRNDIRLVLAEFGPTGVALNPICKELGIPLIVIFHSYDAFHKKLVGIYQESYYDLFRYASSIIGVSEDLCSQLLILGAPKEKVVYLPCGVETAHFTYSDHSQNAPTFLTVGRFTETKSPHITILAFKKVLEKIPEARLVMIGGNDGATGIFEICHSLVRALKIEDKVEFKGILPHEAVKAEMSKVSVFVQHSVTTPIFGDKEGTPVAIMEALASGIPVIATRHAGIAEIIEDRKTGLLVDEFDLDGMAEAMVKMLSDKAYAKQMAHEARLAIQANSLISNNIEHLAEIIKRSIL
ncbi:MAG: glycosyltransferase [Bacteroidota bacterium]